MVFGNKATFAIETELIAEPSSHFFAKICMWAGHRAIGRYEEVDMLTVCSGQLFNTLGWERKDAELEKLSKEQAVKFIHDALYEDEEAATCENFHTLSERYNGFCLSNIGESFDDWFIVLIDSKDGERLIWRARRGDTSVHEQMLNNGEYAAVVSAFLEWVKAVTGFQPRKYRAAREP